MSCVGGDAGAGLEAMTSSWCLVWLPRLQDVFGGKLFACGAVENHEDRVAAAFIELFLQFHKSGRLKHHLRCVERWLLDLNSPACTGGIVTYST